MSFDICSALEHLTTEGWRRVTRRQFRTFGGRAGAGADPVGYYLFTGVLTGRLDIEQLPDPLVDSPRGVPPDCSPGIREQLDEYVDGVSWITVEEILVHDWEPLLSPPWGPQPWVISMLDELCGYGVPREFRFVLWTSH
ncbi:MAG: hypothetical protein K0V04_22440 [Deltaproteobacteria bacterium]|nr:hypothetical protein [Deltaproteobacteria bacterium]